MLDLSIVTSPDELDKVLRLISKQQVRYFLNSLPSQNFLLPDQLLQDLIPSLS